ncbi:hypothetical protein HUJ05_002082 [Dendroctonus ponderosae]|nr:hypothetical protein HUJ05_002082 [Dendroctonus ponderosae]
MEMSDLKAKLKSMQNKESNTDGTAKILCYTAGFRSQNSCETALQSVLLNWKGALEEGKMIGVVVKMFLDERRSFKRTFETINRQLLLLKMKNYGFGDVILDWLGEFLDKRTQVTREPYWVQYCFTV